MTSEQRPQIDPALGLDLVSARTIESRSGDVSIVIPAHNEAATVATVVREAFRSLEILGVGGEVIVAASGCDDNTSTVADDAGARVVETGKGKGVAITGGLAASSGEVVCLIDGDFLYYGDEPLAVSLLRPILRGISDATIADLYWRPLYPQLWLYGFFAPIAGRLFPEILPKVGTTPWSGQRAALRELWPASLPDDFTVDLALLLHWNDPGVRLRPIVADDWTNPQRPKPDLMRAELEVLVDDAIARSRIEPGERGALEVWFARTHELMAEYRPDTDDPQVFERQLLHRSLRELAKA